MIVKICTYTISMHIYIFYISVPVPDRTDPHHVHRHTYTDAPTHRHADHAHTALQQGTGRTVEPSSDITMVSAKRAQGAAAGRKPGATGRKRAQGAAAGRKPGAAGRKPGAKRAQGAAAGRKPGAMRAQGAATGLTLGARFSMHVASVRRAFDSSSSDYSGYILKDYLSVVEGRGHAIILDILCGKAPEDARSSEQLSLLAKLRAIRAPLIPFRFSPHKEWDAVVTVPLGSNAVYYDGFAAVDYPFIGCYIGDLARGKPHGAGIRVSVPKRRKGENQDMIRCEVGHWNNGNFDGNAIRIPGKLPVCDHANTWYQVRGKTWQQILTNYDPTAFTAGGTILMERISLKEFLAIARKFEQRLPPVLPSPDIAAREFIVFAEREVVAQKVTSLIDPTNMRLRIIATLVRRADQHSEGLMRDIRHLVKASETPKRQPHPREVELTELIVPTLDDSDLSDHLDEFRARWNDIRDEVHGQFQIPMAVEDTHDGL